MSMTDPIADMLTRIRNGYMAGKGSITMPYSNEKKNVGDILIQEGYLDSSSVDDSQTHKQLIITLKYDEEGKGAINEITRVSKPGRRIYTKSKDIKPFLNSYGVSIISTSKGVHTDKECTEMNLGGEVICTVW